MQKFHVRINLVITEEIPSVHLRQQLRPRAKEQLTQMRWWERIQSSEKGMESEHSSS